MPKVTASASLSRLEKFLSAFVRVLDENEIGCPEHPPSCAKGPLPTHIGKHQMPKPVPFCHHSGSIILKT